jgi:hypothetical protein
MLSLGKTWLQMFWIAWIDESITMASMFSGNVTCCDVPTLVFKTSSAYYFLPVLLPAVVQLF